MCGIAGIIGNFEEHQLDSMLLSQHHRGPDATGKYCDNGFATLGHNRLAIIDLSMQSNQPFLDTSGRYVLVFNGEIYNYIELKKELQEAYVFKTESDTEVLLAAYIVYGKSCLEKLNGMFSFAIWDNQDKKLFAARDRFGVKPFFYSIKNNSFYFSSEIKAIHAAGISKTPNEKVWASYFAFGSYGMPNETFWSDIVQLPGGHFLSFSLRQAQGDNRQSERCQTEPLESEKSLLEECQTEPVESEKSLLKECQTEPVESKKSLLEECPPELVESEKSLLKECQTEPVESKKSLLEECQTEPVESEKSLLEECQTEPVESKKRLLEECQTEPVESEKSLLKECQTELVESEKSLLKECQTEPVEVITIKKWYCFEDEVAKQTKNLTYAQAKEQYLALLNESVSLRFRADVAVGFNISGGLDSSVLLALVNLQEKDNVNEYCHPEPVEGLHSIINAYTFYTNNLEYDELPWVDSMIAKTKNPLTKVMLQAAEVPVFAKKMEAQQEEPYGGIPTLAYAKIFEQARKENVLVLLDGQGMDEQWAGYDYYTLENDATIQGVVNSPFKINMISDAFLAKAEKPMYPKPFDDAILNKQYRDLFYTKIPRALRFNDRISMMYSTELREPFLDYRLVEFAFSLPLNFKIKEGITKFMLREIASEYLSDDLIFTPKRALQTPQREWLAEDLREWVSQCFATIENSPFSHWFNKTEMQKEAALYFAGNIQSSFHIWQCISLCQMLETINDELNY